MRKRFAIRKLFHLMCVGGILGLSTNAFASAFQLWEQDGASVGDYHAGRVAEGNDASISYYNPAGITRFKNQQLVFGDVAVMSDLKFRGTINTALVTPIGIVPVGNTMPTVSQGGAFSQLPNFHYIAPLNEYIGVGLSLAVPFGLKTDYGRSTPVRYAATKSYLEVVDLSPAVGFNITKKISLGVGLDMERIAAELDSMATVGPGTDSYGTNKGWGTAYGYHIGSMFQFTPTWRVGFTYNSQVVQHPRGNSRFVGPIANAALGIPLGTPATIYSGETNVHLTLPGYFTLSGFGQVDPKWAVMGTAIYTQWNVIQVLSLQQVSAANAALGLIPTPVPHVGIVPVASTTTTVNLPTHYRNTWNLAAGTEYYATERVTIRGGIGFDETPVVNSYRDVRIPDGNRYAVAMGAHFQATKTLGLDFGYTHLFLFGTTSVNPPPLQDGAQIVTTHGNVTGSADVFGAQLVWDIL